MSGFVLVNSHRAVDLDTYALHLTRGRWHWGKNADAAPIGMELWANFHSDKTEQWKQLINGLSGIYCTSVSLVTDDNTIHPSHTFGNGSVWYAQLPRENLCTENLTPFLKLLPCRQKSGLASLLSSPIFSALHVSLGSELQCNEGCILTQTVSVVFERTSDNPCDILKATFIKPCAVASTSHVNQQESHSICGLIVPSTADISPDITVDRLIGGYGQEHGTLVTRISTSDEPARVDFCDSLPFFIKPYFHTLNVSLTPLYTKIVVSSTSLLEIGLDMPKNTTVDIVIDFDHVFLHFTDYPPDANRGFDLPSAVVKYGSEYRSYSQPLLIPGPSPDFSMMYNVVTITSTVIALMFGTVFNILTAN